MRPIQKHPALPDKGQKHGECARTACQNRSAVYFNRSTRRYYCGVCARLINDANRADAKRLYGGELCVPDDEAGNP